MSSAKWKDKQALENFPISVESSVDEEILSMKRKNKHVKKMQFKSEVMMMVTPKAKSYLISIFLSLSH